MGEPEVNGDGGKKRAVDGSQAGDFAHSAKGHLLDDALYELANKTVDRYLEELIDSRDRIERTQLSAIVRHTESFGAKGFSALIKDHRDKNRRNEQALSEKKGGKKPKNKQFWDILKEVADKELPELAGNHEREKELYVLFASRLAIELNYRNKCSGNRDDYKSDSARRRGGRDSSRKDQGRREKSGKDRGRR